VPQVCLERPELLVQPVRRVFKARLVHLALMVRRELQVFKVPQVCLERPELLVP
jgi:hypothetical protein